jgi:hypothetical protein
MYELVTNEYHEIMDAIISIEERGYKIEILINRENIVIIKYN